MSKHPHQRATIITRDGKTGVLCRCDAFAPFDNYCIAQMAMGHTLNRNCACGLHSSVAGRGNNYVVSRQVEGHVFERGMKPVKEST